VPAGPPLTAGKGPIQWKWVAIGAAVILAVQFGFGVILGVIGLATGAPQLTVAGVGAVSLLGFPIGGLIVALISPGLTIREPAIGAVIPIALFALLNRGESLLSLPFVYVVTLGGAKLGERLQARRRSRMRT
jgi:hypothetical protein